MKTTNLELSRELYEAFGWDDTDFQFQYSGWNGNDWRLEYGRPTMLDTDADRRYGKQPSFPAYDLAYLLDKLPDQTLVKRYTKAKARDGGTEWVAVVDDHPWNYTARADNPTDAAGLLALKLREEGIL